MTKTKQKEQKQTAAPGAKGVQVKLADRVWDAIKASADAEHRTMRAECAKRLEDSVADKLAACEA